MKIKILSIFALLSIGATGAWAQTALTPNEDKTVWTTSMPAYDIVMSAEYYDEANLNDVTSVTTELTTFAGEEIWVNYTREFTASKPSTICLPFAYVKKEGEKFYTFTGITNESGEYIADMTEYEGATLEPNTPYLVNADVTGNVDFSEVYTIPEDIETLEAGSTTSGDWTFRGTYETIEWATAPVTPTYGFSAQDANDGIVQGQFVRVGNYVRIKPMRAYLEYSGSAALAKANGMSATAVEQLPTNIKVRLISAEGEVTAIGTINTKTGEVTLNGWYTIDGKPLSGKPTKPGIYVNNGNKVVIK